MIFPTEADEAVNDAVARALRRARADRAMTQGDFAALLGLGHYTVVSRWEKGQHRFTLAEAVHICTALPEYTLTDLLSSPRPNPVLVAARRVLTEKGT